MDEDNDEENNNDDDNDDKEESEEEDDDNEEEEEDEEQKSKKSDRCKNYGMVCELIKKVSLVLRYISKKRKVILNAFLWKSRIYP